MTSAVASCVPVLPRLLAAALIAVLANGVGAAPAEAPPPAAGAQAPAEDAQTVANKRARAELAAQRAAVQKAYDEKQKDCRARFAVTSCLEEAKTWHIEALRPIQRQEKDVNDRERQQRAAAQRERVKAKDQEAADEASRHGTSAVKAATHPAPDVGLPPARTPRANPALHQRQLQKEQAQAEQRAAERRQAASDRRELATEQQRQSQKQIEKQAQRASDAKRPAPVHLPTPSASDIQSLPKR